MKAASLFFLPTHFGFSDTNVKVLNQFRCGSRTVVQLSKELGGSISQASLFTLYIYMGDGRQLY